MIVGLLGAPTGTALADSADLAITSLAVTVSDISPSVVQTVWDLTNNGPSAATDLVLVVTLPPGTSLISGHIAARPTCSFDPPSRQVSCPLGGSFDAGSSTGAAVMLLNVGNPAGSAVEVRGTIIASTADPDPSNNTRSATIVVPGGPVPVLPDGPSAELVLKAASALPASLLPADVGLVSWDLVNLGPALAERLTIVLEFPEGVTPINGNVSTVPCGNYDPGRRTLTCAFDAAQPGARLVASASFPTAGWARGTRIPVVARVTSATPDPDPANNVSTSTFVVGGPVPDDGAIIPETGAATGAVVGVAIAFLAIGIVLTLIGSPRRRTVGERRSS